MLSSRHHLVMLPLPKLCGDWAPSGPWCQDLILSFWPFPLSHSSFHFAVGNYTQAVECAKTYLLFFPNDEVMNQNLAYYAAMLGEEHARSIGPREVRNFLLLWQLPAELLNADLRAEEWGSRGESVLRVQGRSQVSVSGSDVSSPTQLVIQRRKEHSTGGSVGSTQEPQLALSGPRSLFSESCRTARRACSFPSWHP